MKKRIIIGAVVAGFFLIGAIGSSNNQPTSPNLNASKPTPTASATKATAQVIKPTCDGLSVTMSCMLDGVTYSTYIYHPAIPEKSHTETVTTYKQEIIGYCTLCSDGTYSPTCATGRGACSHHGGVAQWNAPQYSTVPDYTTRIVIDSPAQKAYYEKSPQ